MTNKSKKISVISIFYNRDSLVKKTVNSLLKQSESDYELILVDDGSTDNTKSELLIYKNEPKVKLIFQENMGFTKSIIKAISLSSGQFIAIQGSGDLSHYERLRKQSLYLEKNLSCVVVGCGRKVVDEIDNRLIKKISRKGVLDQKQLLKYGNPFSHGEVMFRKSAYDSVNGYREFFRYAQDYDLWLRLSKIGTLDLIEDVLYEEYSRRDGVRNDYKKRIQQVKYGQIAKASINNSVKNELILKSHNNSLNETVNYLPNFIKKKIVNRLIFLAFTRSVIKSEFSYFAFIDEAISLSKGSALKQCSIKLFKNKFFYSLLRSVLLSVR